MRKLAPAFILTTIVALSSGSALALGDMNKNKKSPSATTTSTLDASNPADKRYSSTTNPSSNSAATASDTGRDGATTSSSTSGSSSGAPMSATTNSVPSSGSNTMATEGMKVDKSRKWSAKDCEGLAMTDPTYKSNNCGSMKSDSKGGGN